MIGLKKNKKRSFLIILLLFVVCISIGYAAITTTLNINGDTKIKSASWDVHFENLVLSDGIVTATTDATIDSTKTVIDYSIKLVEPGDFYEFTVDIVNKGTIDAMISEILEEGLSVEQEKYINYSVTYIDGSSLTAKDLLPAGGVETVRVKVEFKKDVTAEDLPKEESVLNLKFSVAYVQANDTAVERLLPIIMAFEADSTVAYKSETYAPNIKTINLEKTINVPSDAVESWDIGQAQNGNVMAYVVKNSEDTSKYDLYIQGDGALYANEDSKFLFNNMPSTTSINNLTILDTSLTKNMSYMFSDLVMLKSLDVSRFDTSNVVNMESMFNCTGFNSDLIEIIGLENFDTSNVTNMSLMFAGFAYASKNDYSFTLSNWDVSKVDSFQSMFLSSFSDSGNIYINLDGWKMKSNANVNDMFCQTGNDSNLFEISLKNWKLPSDISYLFNETAYNAPTWKANVSGWDTTNTTDMSYAFYQAGTGSQDVIITGLDDFDTQNVTDMQSMFYGFAFNYGYYGTHSFLLDLSSWDVSKVKNKNSMFYYVCANTGWECSINLANWKTDAVIDMSKMFYYTGHGTHVFIIDATGWNTANVENMSEMFSYAGYYATGMGTQEFKLLGLENWNTGKVSNMNKMFYEMGGNGNTSFKLDLSGWDVSSVTDRQNFSQGNSSWLTPPVW